MPTSFSIPRSRCAVLTDPDLREEIRERTGSEAETSSILRSLERFGLDASVRYYEMTPRSRRAHRTTPECAWIVSAVR